MKASAVLMSYRAIFRASFVALLICWSVLNAQGKALTRAQSDKSCSANADNAELLAKHFTVSAPPHGWDNSNCGGADYLSAMHKADPAVNKLFVNIGFNKGLNFAEYVSYWQPWYHIDAKKWADISKGIEKDAMPYHCPLPISTNFAERSKESPIITHGLTDQIRPTFVGVDLNKFNVHFVKQVVERIDEDLKRSKTGSDHHLDTNKSFMKLRLVHAAASNTAGGTIKVASCGNTTHEGCKIDTIFGQEKVNVISVDSMAAAGMSLSSGKDRNGAHWSHEHHPVIDVLQIDAEGNDPKVLQGAEESLKSGIVRVLVFEYHGNCPWPTIGLEKQISILDDFGYDCFFIGKTRLWQITGCWHSLFEFYRWANVICVKRGDKWHKPLSEMQMTIADIPEDKQAELKAQQMVVEANEEEMAKKCAQENNVM